MCALAPLNLLVVLGSHLSPALGEARGDGLAKMNFSPPEERQDEAEVVGSFSGLWKEILAEPPPVQTTLPATPTPLRRRQPSTAAREAATAAAGASVVVVSLLSAATAAAAPMTVLPPSSSCPSRLMESFQPGAEGVNGWAPDARAAPNLAWPASTASASCTAGAAPVDPDPEVLEVPKAGGSRPSREPKVPVWKEADDNDRCMRACPGMVMVPRSIVDLDVSDNTFAARRRDVARFILVMSEDNIAALVVIGALSVLGAIYLWKICTRKSCSCRLCRNQYRTLHLIGAGGYGSVYLVERLGDGSRFVSKKIPVREITEVDEYSKEAKELVTLRHRHIVSYEEDFVHVEYGALEPKTYFIIIMEYCPEGDLKSKIELDFCCFTEEWVRTVFAQLLQAVQYLHSKSVIHRDLKSQNVFLAYDGRVRLGDFGLCRHTPSRALGSATLTHAGTDCYMAPEMLSSSRYGKPADMWSLGCVLYELCTGQFMWELDGILGAMVMKDAHTVSKLIHEYIVPSVGQSLTSVLKRLLSVNPANRPTATACMRRKVFRRGFPLSRQSFGESLDEAASPPGTKAPDCPAASPQQLKAAQKGTKTAAAHPCEVESLSSSSSSSSSTDSEESESALNDAPLTKGAAGGDGSLRRRRWRRRAGGRR